MAVARGRNVLVAESGTVPEHRLCSGPMHDPRPQSTGGALVLQRGELNGCAV
jgi:hypothetical protein